MYRARIERLEERRLFSVTDLIIDPFQANVVGDFNGDGTVDAADFAVDARTEAGTQNVRRNQRIEVENDETHWVGRDRAIGVVAGNFIGVDGLLPYLEQDNVYKIGDRGAAQPVSITDGSSNTLMFGESAQSISPVNVDLLGALVDTSPIELSVLSLDTWEHAYLTDYGPTNSIIALLVPAAIGTPTGSVTFGLAADPSDASIVYLSSEVRFIRVDTSGMTDSAASLVSPLHQSNPEKSLLGSDEFFSRFANTTLDDEALVATTFGRGIEARKLTHDAEFETWASVSSFDRGYLPPALEDVLVSGIVHENEFSFPRMFAGGVRVG